MHARALYLFILRPHGLQVHHVHVESSLMGRQENGSKGKEQVPCNTYLYHRQT